MERTDPQKGLLLVVITVVAMGLCILRQRARKKMREKISSWQIEGKGLSSSSYFPFLYVPEHPRESPWPPSGEVVAPGEQKGLLGGSTASATPLLVIGETPSPLHTGNGQEGVES